MRNGLIAISLVLIAGCVAGIYFYFIKDSEAYVTFKKFSIARAYGRREEAMKYADNESLIGGPEEIRAQWAGGMPVDALTAILYHLESQKENGDGGVTLSVIQAVRFDPPGATSAMGAMISKYRQTADLKKTAAGWRVVSFNSEFVENRNWKGEKED